MPSILIDNRDSVLRLTLNRPDVRNAFDEEVIAALTAAAGLPPPRRTTARRRARGNRRGVLRRRRPRLDVEGHRLHASART